MKEIHSAHIAMNMGFIKSISFKHSRIAVLTMTVCLVLFVGFLVSIDYYWQVKARELAIKNVLDETVQRSTAISYFFSERYNDMVRLVEGGAIDTYFANEALGMSMQYGLGASLQMIENNFRRLLDERRIGGVPIYQEVILVSRDGEPLMRACGLGESPSGLRDWSSLLTRNRSDAFLSIGHEDHGAVPELIVSCPYWFKGAYEGQILARLAPAALEVLLAGQEDGNPGGVYFILCEGGELFASGEQNQSVRQIDRAVLQGMKFREPTFIPVKTGGTERRDVLAIRQQVGDFPLSLLTLRPKSEIFGLLEPWHLPIAMSVLALFFLAGVVEAFNIHTRNGMLHARLEAADAARGQIEKNNRILALEVAERKEKERALEHEKYVNESLARLGGILIASPSVEDILTSVLDYAMFLTESPTGFVGLLDPERGVMPSRSFDMGIWDICKVAGAITLFEDNPALWGRVFSHKESLLKNDSGCGSIRRIISVPALIDGCLMGQITLAQGVRPYTSNDLAVLKSLAALYAISVQRKRDEELLKNSNAELERRVLRRTKELTASYEWIEREMAEKEKSQEELFQWEKRFRNVIESAPIGIGIIQSGKYRFVNPAFVHMFGYDSEEEILGLALEDIYSPEAITLLLQQQSIHLNGKDLPKYYETKGVKKSGDLFSMAVGFTYIIYEGEKSILGFVLDISEQRNLQEQLFHAQKMETVGRLAGGIAHDFNNILSAILGFTQLSIEQIDINSIVYENLKEVVVATRRASDIVRQLMAFSRKQDALQKIVDVNVIVVGMLKMLKRMIGEDIKVEWLPGETVWNVKFDPVQLDQVLANLCVNARDAISGTGNIVIKTSNIVLDESFCSRFSNATPGEYVVLSVLDDGCGMSEEVLSKVFEPFFTTKELGRGTGLGLSTVYGIVAQNGGFIDIHSKVGNGTSVEMYMPRDEVHEEKMLEKPLNTNMNSQGDVESILLVEDDPVMLRLMEKMLQNMGYQVFAAGNPLKAMNIAQKLLDEVDLLITDIIMPDMNGKELAKYIAELIPGIGILFMSGYATDFIGESMPFGKDTVFLQKPFSVSELECCLKNIVVSKNFCTKTVLNNIDLLEEK